MTTVVMTTVLAERLRSCGQHEIAGPHVRVDRGISLRQLIRRKTGEKVLRAVVGATAAIVLRFRDGRSEFQHGFKQFQRGGE